MQICPVHVMQVFLHLVQYSSQDGSTLSHYGSTYTMLPWCDNVLPSWEEFCTKVQEDLHDMYMACLHKATLHLCILTSLFYVTQCIVHISALRRINHSCFVSALRCKKTCMSWLRTSLPISRTLLRVDLDMLHSSWNKWPSCQSTIWRPTSWL